MIKRILKEVKKNLTKRNIIIFCAVFIFLFSGLLSIMLYGVGKNKLTEYEKSDVVYPENSTEMYREELERESDIKVGEILEKNKHENVPSSSSNEEQINPEENRDTVTNPEISMPEDKVIVDIEEPKDDEVLGDVEDEELFRPSLVPEA